MKQFLLSVLSVVFIAIVAIGCGDSEDIINTPPPAQNTGSTQVQFNRSNALTQTVEEGFATATVYTVDVFNAGTREPVRPTTQVAADTSQDLQVIVLTNIPIGSYDVVVTAFSNGTNVGQIIATGVPINNDLTTIVGTGEGATLSFAEVTGTPYPVNFPNDGGTGTTSTGTGTNTTTTSSTTTSSSSTGSGTGSTTSSTSGSYTGTTSTTSTTSGGY